MDLSTLVSRHAGAILVIDDHLSGPKFDLIPIAAYTALYDLLDQDEAARAAMGGLLEGCVSLDAGGLVKEVQANPGRLFQEYRSGSHSALLGTLFDGFDAEYKRSRLRVDKLVGILEAFFGVKPLTFASIEEARPHIANCLLAFLDFYLDGVSNDAEAVQRYVTIKEELLKKVDVSESSWPKVVFLVSAQLPQQAGLDAFRTELSIKSAFFHTLDKREIEDEPLRRKLERSLNYYVGGARLSAYLESVSDAIQIAAGRLVSEVSRLELHDVTMLKSLRLDAESESLESYLTWLLSESLAVKLRSDEGVQRALLPLEESLPPLDGKLLPGSVLFELFSEIAVAPSRRAEGSGTIVTGDAFEDLRKGAAKGSVILVIAPACDLLRCELSYDVLCVRGTVDAVGASLAELYARSYAFGKGKVVLKQMLTGTPVYRQVSWDPKKLVTIPTRELRNVDLFKPVARLSEMFAQEIKELALSQVSRIGTPVDPSFSVAVQALVRLNLLPTKGSEFKWQCDLSEKDFVPAVLAMGRSTDAAKDALEKTVIFTHQFLDWIALELDRIGREVPAASAQIKAFRDFFDGGGPSKAVRGVSLGRALNGKLMISYADHAPLEEGTKGLEICLFPFER